MSDHTEGFRAHPNYRPLITYTIGEVARDLGADRLGQDVYERVLDRVDTACQRVRHDLSITYSLGRRPSPAEHAIIYDAASQACRAMLERITTRLIVDRVQRELSIELELGGLRGGKPT